jgi:hypothetical protein
VGLPKTEKAHVGIHEGIEMIGNCVSEEGQVALRGMECVNKDWCVV